MAALLLAGLFGSCLRLYTRHNAFPAYYHDDEQDKAWQVIGGTRNFNHPQLMLETAQLVARVTHAPPEVGATVRAGRDASAALAALGVVAMAAAGFRAYGFPGLIVTGLAVGLCPAVLVYSHYMKEDASLVAGVGACVLAAQVVWTHRWQPVHVPSLCLLGAACGLAASGKYTGAFALAVAVPFAAGWGRPRWPAAAARVAVVVLAAAVLFALVNHRALGHLGAVVGRLRGEGRQALDGLWGLRLARPNLYHPAAFVRQCMPHVLALSAAYAAVALARPRRAGWGLFVAAFGAGYLGLICFSAVPFTRYVLPAVVLAHLAAALGVLAAAAALPGRALRWTLWAAGVAAVVAVQLPRCLDFSAQFADDSRERLRAWVARNLPADAVFVQDGYVALGEPFDPRVGRTDRPDIRIYGSRGYGCGQSAADAGDLEHLRRLGVDYVAVADTEYDWYLDPNVAPADDCRETFLDRRRWYQELFRSCPLVWRSAPAHPTFSQYTNPEIRLYRLGPGQE